MLKRPLVSIFHSLKVKGRRYYCDTSNNQELINTSIINNKDNSDKIMEILENQEKKQIKIIDELTKQKKAIEQISYKLNEMEKYSFDSRIIQILMLFNSYILFISK
jgi:hypothetical protein